ncbi:xanthine dehydrogenase small subunit [Glutamicibacter sp. NPDC087344]|uniref:xanthine dehydrogenase small subunit n=1 Tax=Glutamicibacter sp. NPDC087344 TaxID=3363994 RepID=UPI00380F7D3B
MAPESATPPRCTVTVNHKAQQFAGPPHTNALDFLRGLGLTSCKEGCAEGECGACAILLARTDGERSRWSAVNACLIPAAALEGQHVLTAEGLGTVSEPHPVQHQLAEHGGSQCGYCTPGFVCAMAAEFYRPERAEQQVAEAPGPHTGGPNGFDLHALSGNLCRCTGYRPIKDAAFELGMPEPEDHLTQVPATRPAPTDYWGADTPAGAVGRFRRPETLSQALQILSEEPDTKVIAGATDWGIEVNLKSARANSVLAIDRLAQLRRVVQNENYLELGAACTLSELERALAGRVPLLDLLWPNFASRLIRNSATLGGNLGTGSPIGDSPPVLLALDAQVVLVSVSGERVVPLENYFTGYRQSVRQPDELISAIRIPMPLAARVSFQKIAKRRFDDISSVAVALAFDVQAGRITRARIGVGGVAATPVRATATEQLLLGLEWNEQSMQQAGALLSTEGTPLDDHRASAAYRRAMLGSALERFFAEQETERRAGS